MIQEVKGNGPDAWGGGWKQSQEKHVAPPCEERANLLALNVGRGATWFAVCQLFIEK